MKRLATMAAALLLAAVTAAAQISAGAGYLNSTKKQYDKSATAGGFFAEAAYARGIGYGFALSAGLRYSYLACSDPASAGFVNYSVMGSLEEKEHYLSLPLHVQYIFPFYGGADLVFFLGPEFSYCVSSRTSLFYEEPVLGSSSRFTLDNVAKGYKPFDVIGSAGLSVDLFGKVRLTGSYGYGFLDHAGKDYNILRRSEWRVGVSYLF